MSRLLIFIFFCLSSFIGVSGNDDMTRKDELSGGQSDHDTSASFQEEQSFIYFGIVPEKIITDTNLLTATKKNFFSFDYLSQGLKDAKFFFEDSNLPYLILKDNLFLSILLI
jgi:hypothetical protein